MKMKNLLVIFSVVFFLVQGCSKDACKDVTCVNGSCESASGNCICNNAYEKDSDGKCTKTWAEKHAGTYQAIETCNIGTDSYKMSIAAVGSSTPLAITISNFGNYGITVTGSVTEGSFQQLQILQQSVSIPVSGGSPLIGQVSGSAWLDTSTGILTLTYKVEGISAINSSCTVTMTRN